MDRSIGARLKQLRKSKGLSAQQLGDILRMTGQAISQIENNKRGISLDLAIALADFYGLSLDDLAGRAFASKEQIVIAALKIVARELEKAEL